MGLALAVASQKGGVGKTTVAANVAAGLASLGLRTLLVETDPQGSLIGIFGFDRFDIQRGLFGALQGKTPAGAALERGVASDLDLLPANVWSHEEELAFTDLLRREPHALTAVLEQLTGEYEYVILDSPPGLGPITRAVLAAADRYLVPVQAESMNLRTLARLEYLAEGVRASRNPDLVLDGIVITMWDPRTRHAQSVLEHLVELFPKKLYETRIPRSVRVAEECDRGRPTVLSSPRHRAGEAFQLLAEEVLSRHLSLFGSGEGRGSGRASMPDEGDPGSGDPDLRVASLVEHLPLGVEDAQDGAVRPRFGRDLGDLDVMG
jgi:chromosome partitioning protein